MIGKMLSHYEIRSKLGEGGMGEVWEAHDPRLDRVVAIKLIPKHLSADPIARKRFVHEAQAASSIEHANICTIHEIDESSEGETFIVMPRYQGEPLSELIARERLPLRDALHIVEDLAGAMAEAHDHDIIHRDVKPANIIIDQNSRPILLDFGLAKLSTHTQLTKTGTTMGTLAYMAPEQAAGGEVDHRVDLFALGVVLYELVTGVRPFTGDHDAAVLYSIAHQPAPPLATHDAGLPPALQSIIDRSLAKDPKNRYATMHDFKNAVGELRLELQMASGTRAGVSSRPRLRPRWLLPVAVVVILGAVGGIFSLRSNKPIASADEIIMAVLPLKDLSQDSDQEYFADGFTGELIAGLTRVNGLKVMARGSVLEFRDSDLSVKQIADRLEVNQVVTGTIQQENEILRITVEIIDIAKGLATWANTFNGSEKEILQLQGSMTRSIVEALKGEVTPDEERLFSGAQEIDPEAYRSYLKGYALMDTWGYDEIWHEALGHFRNAVKIEPGFAPAFAAQSEIYNYLGWIYPDMGYPEMCEAAADKALDLDPELPEALAAKANYLFLFENRFEEARSLFVQAVDSAPNNTKVLGGYGTFLMLSGQCDETVRIRRLCVELDPLNFGPSRELANALVNCNQLEEGIALITSLKERFQGEATHLDYFLAFCYAGLGQIDQAVTAADSSAVNPGGVASIYWRAGRKNEAWEMVGGRDEIVPHFLEERITLLILEEDYDSAMDIIEMGIKERPVTIKFTLNNYLFEPLHDQPRFQALMRSMNIPGY